MTARSLNRHAGTHLSSEQLNGYHLPVIIIEIDLPVAAIRLRNCTEDTVSFTSGDNSHIVVGVGLEGTASVLLDCGGCGSCLCTRGKIPVPFSGRIGGKEHIVTIGTVDDVPAQLLSETAPLSAVYILGERCNEHDVGPGTVRCDPSVADLDSADCSVIYMLIVQSVKFDSVVLGVDITVASLVCVASIGPGAADLIRACAGNLVPRYGASCKVMFSRTVGDPLYKSVVTGFLHSCFRTGESERAEDKNGDQKAGSQTFDCFNHFFSLHRQVNETRIKNLR